jgi:hypothetical protein
MGDLAVKSGNQASEAVFTDEGVEIFFVHESASESAVQCSIDGNVRRVDASAASRVTCRPSKEFSLRLS